MSAEFNVDKDGNVTMTVDGRVIVDSREIDYPLRHLEDIENEQNEPSDQTQPKKYLTGAATALN